MTTSMNHKKIDWKKYTVFAAMGLLFIGAMYVIFVPSEKSKEEQKQGMGLNTDVPEPARNEIVEDKRTAYEHEQALLMQQKRLFLLVGGSFVFYHLVSRRLRHFGIQTHTQFLFLFTFF